MSSPGLAQPGCNQQRVCREGQRWPLQCRSDKRGDIVRVRTSLFLSLSLSSFFSFLSYLRYVLSGLASPLHLFPSPFGAPFTSSCHRFLLPPASYKDAQETCLSLLSRDGMPRDRSRRRLQALAFQHVAACVCRRATLTEIPRPSSSFTTSFSPSVLSRFLSAVSGMPIQAHLSGKVFTVNAPTRIFRVRKDRCYTDGITLSIVRSEIGPSRRSRNGRKRYEFYIII